MAQGDNALNRQMPASRRSFVKGLGAGAVLPALGVRTPTRPRPARSGRC